MTELLGRVSPERKDLILARAEELVREERGRRGRSAPDQNQSTAAPTALYRYLQGVVMGCVMGLMIGYLLGIIFPSRHDDCQVRASSAHVSLCLDAQLKKAKGLFN